MTDWFDQKRTHSVTVQMVDPHNLETVIGVLEGVDLSSSKVSAGYYTDARTTATIMVVGGGWIPGSYLRFVIDVGADERVLGTYRVYDDKAQRVHGTWRYTYDCKSMLYRIAQDCGAGAWTIKNGTTAMKAAAQDLTWAGAAYSINGNDALINTPVVYESGMNRLSHIMSLCTMADNRVDVDGYGTIVIDKYVEPSSMPPSFTLDLEDTRGIVHSGIGVSSDRYSLENRVVVSYQSNSNGNQTEVVGYADVTGNLSPTASGAVITDYRIVDSLNPPTTAAAYDLAKKYAALQKPANEWSIKTQYLPIWEGDVIALVVHDGSYTGERRCLVQNIDIALDTLELDLRLKEVGND